MSGNKTKDTRKSRGNSVRKPPPRWRRYLVQAELELPPPAHGTAHVGGSLDDDWQAGAASEPLRRWQSPVAVAGLAALCVVLLVATAWSLRRASIDRASAVSASRSVQELTVRAASDERDLRIAPNPRSWSSAPDVVLRAPEPPEMLNLFFAVGYTTYTSFAITIDKADHGRVLTVQRVTADSNRDLRLSLNSSAFGRGEYRIRIQGYAWQGKRVDAGWVRLIVS